MVSFDDMSKDAVKRFIQTVAIIDDEASYSMELLSHEDNGKPKTVNTPVEGPMTGNPGTGSSTTTKDSTEEEFQDDHENFSFLDASVVINSFADMGIACCIQCPKHEDDPKKRAVKLAASVDIIVLDWVLDEENRSLPRDIIKKILEEDKSKGDRMRLIIVYTSHNFVKEMLKDLKEDADDVYKGGLVMEERHLLIKGDCLRIVILNKKATVNSPEDARIVSFEDLPENVISEYAELMKGIIPCATLHSIAAMREKTQKLLSILNSNLDGAYCLHRALLLKPSDSVDFAMNLITSEIETVIQSDIEARQFVDQKGIEPSLNNLNFDGVTKPTLRKWITEGGLSKKEQMKKLLNAFYDNNQTKGLNGCRELSRLKCTMRDTVDRMYYSDSQQPTLQLGTILKAPKKIGGELFLCIMPSCDCFSLEGETNFFFLQLHRGDNSHADIMIKTQDDTYEPLLLKIKKLKILTIPFKPKNGSYRINAHRWNKQWRIKSTTDSSYQWIAELRSDKALAINHLIAANSSRVGVNEFEWLRRQAPN